MVNILDMSSGMWEREIGGDHEWKSVCAEEYPEKLRATGCPGMALRQLEPAAVTMPPELLRIDLDQFLIRMQTPEIE